MYVLPKRLFDIFLSLFLLFFLSLPFVLIYFFVKFNSSKGPVIYKGKRAFNENKTFELLKFRTMVVDAEKKGGFSTALNDERLTSVGRTLRKYKLDELPQLVNILRGEMSFVGPRPQVTFYTNKYNSVDKEILRVKPGLTDLSSLFFFDMDKTLGSENADEKYEKEVEPIKNVFRVFYARNISFKLDLVILISTLLIIFPIFRKIIKKKLNKIFLESI